MSFLSKALRRAEVFLEQVDESVAQANRRLVVEGATGDVDDEDEWIPGSDDPLAAGVLSGNVAQQQEVLDDSVVDPDTPFQRRSGTARFARSNPVRDGRASNATHLEGIAAPTAAGSSVDLRGVQSQAPSQGRNEEAGAAPGEASTAAPDEWPEEQDGWGDLDIPDVDPADSVEPGAGADVVVSSSHAPPAVVAPPQVRNASDASLADVKKAMQALPPGQESGRHALPSPQSSTLPTSTSGTSLGSPASGEAPRTVGAAAVDVDMDDTHGKGLDRAQTDTAPEPVLAGSSQKLAGQELPAATKHSDKGNPIKPEAMSDSNVRAARGRNTARSPSPAGEHATDDEVSGLIDENEDLRKELELAEDDIENLVGERTKLLNNLRRLKELVSEMDSSLEEKSADVRSLGNEVAELEDEKKKLQRQYREAVAKGKDELDLQRKELLSEVAKFEEELEVSRREERRLTEENSSIRDALTEGREVDMATADDARLLASNAQASYEAEVAAHRETREALKAKQEALDSEAGVTAGAIAAAQRQADEAVAAATAAKSSLRNVENRLSRVSEARDIAVSRIQDLTEELKGFTDREDGIIPGNEELVSLRQTVSELETALEAKNVELTRLEGEVENLRSTVQSRGAANLGSPMSGAASAHIHEVEQKLRHMADSALRKQAQLDVLRSENKALQLQLDTERKRTREAQAMAAVATSSRHTLRGGFRGILDVGDEERGSRSYAPREGPMARLRTPRNWPSGISRFLASLDKLSAEALSFFRKEPLLRIVILLYICAMHVLVYGLLHFHVESTFSSDQPTGIHAHPHEPLVPPQ